jgi:hypothetical protein
MSYSDWYHKLKAQNPELYNDLLSLNRKTYKLRKSNGQEYVPIYKRTNDDGDPVKELTDYRLYQKNYQSIYRSLKKDIYKCEVCNKGFIYPYLLDAHYNKPIHIKMVFKELPNNI